MIVEQLTADMRGRGIGTAAQRKALVVLSAVLSAVAQWKKISTNPLWRMPKPPAGRQRHPHPFPPLLIERIKLRLSRRGTKSGPYCAVGDATLVSLLSYAGLRPDEALALTWGDVQKPTLAVDKAVAEGIVGATKTGAVRSVPLVEHLGVVKS